MIRLSCLFLGHKWVGPQIDTIGPSPAQSEFWDDLWARAPFVRFHPIRCARCGVTL